MLVAMLSNYISALKAMLIMLIGFCILPFQVFEHPRVSYYIKSIKINRPLSARIRNIPTFIIPTLKPLIELSARLSNGIVFLVGYFGFFACQILFPT